MPSIYTCPKCSHILGYDLYRTIHACPQCGQPFEQEQMRRIVSGTRWMHVLILTPVVALGIGVAAALVIMQMEGGKELSQRGINAMLIGFGAGLPVAFVGLVAWDRKRHG